MDFPESEGTTEGQREGASTETIEIDSKETKSERSPLESMRVETTAVVSRDTSTIALPEVRLVAHLWNLQDLGGGPSRGPVRSPDVKRAIAALIKHVDADFVALLEVKKTGPKPKAPEKPKTPPELKSDPIGAYYVPAQKINNAAMGDQHGYTQSALKAIVGTFVYWLVTRLVWERVRAVLAPAEAEEGVEYEPEQRDALESTEATSEVVFADPTPEESEKAVGSSADESRKAAARAPTSKGRMNEDDLRTRAAAIEADRVHGALKSVVAAERTRSWLKGAAGLTKAAAELQRAGVRDWAGIELGNSRAWPRGNDPPWKSPKNKNVWAALDNGFRGSFNGVRTKEDQDVLKCLDGTRKYCDAVAKLELHEKYKALGELQPQVHEWVERTKDLAKQIEVLQKHCAFLTTVADQVLAAVLKDVVDELEAQEKLDTASGYPALNRGVAQQGLPLAMALLNATTHAREARYKAALEAYTKKKKELETRGTYPGLRELQDIVKLVDPGGEVYGVWPPREVLQQVEQETKDETPREPEGKGVESPYAKYFTNGEESYGILYKKDVFDDRGSEAAPVPQPGFLSGYQKRQPLVFPLRVRKLGAIVRFIPWHAPAPSAGNAQARAKDFPQFARDTAAFRANKQLAVLMSDTNVDTTGELAASNVEHWDDKTAKAMTRADLLDLWTGQPNTLATLLDEPTSLVSTKLQAVENAFVVNNAAYDKVVIVSATTGEASGGAMLLQGRQQLVSMARALQLDEGELLDEGEKGEGETPKMHRGRSIVVHASSRQRDRSPLSNISRKLDPTLKKALRPDLPARAPARAQQLVKDARKISDHDGVLSEMFLIAGGAFEGLQPLITGYATKHAGNGDASKEWDALANYLSSVHFGEQVLGRLLDVHVFEGRTGELAGTQAPESEVTLDALRTVLANLGKSARRSAPASTSESDPIVRDGGTIIENPGGGDCLFYAVCQLRHGTDLAPAALHHAALGLRYTAVAHLKRILAGEVHVPEGFVQTLGQLFAWHKAGWPRAAAYAGGEGSVWVHYMAEMLKPGTWADLILLLVVSHMLNQRFHLYVKHGNVMWTDVVDAQPELEREGDRLLCTHSTHWEAVVVRRERREDAMRVEVPRENESAPPPSTRSSRDPRNVFDKGEFVVLWGTSDKSWWWTKDRIEKEWQLDKEWLFVFGDNHQRSGMGGQAAIRKRPGKYQTGDYWIGLRTCETGSQLSGNDDPVALAKRLVDNTPDERATEATKLKYTFPFLDTNLQENKRRIEKDLKRIEQESANFDRLVLPWTPDIGFPGWAGKAGYDLGTNLAAMPAFAPDTFKWMQERLEQFHQDMNKKYAHRVKPLSTAKRPPPSGPPSAPPKSDRGGDEGGDSSESKGPLKRRAVEVNLGSSFGIASKSSGFGHVDANASRKDTIRLPVSLLPPILGTPLEERLEPSALQELRGKLAEEFRTESAKLDRALEDGNVDEIRLRSIWGTPWTGSEELIDESLRQEFQTLVESCEELRPLKSRKLEARPPMETTEGPPTVELTELQPEDEGGEGGQMTIETTPALEQHEGGENAVGTNTDARPHEGGGSDEMTE